MAAIRGPHWTALMLALACTPDAPSAPSAPSPGSSAQTTGQPDAGAASSAGPASEAMAAAGSAAIPVFAVPEAQGSGAAANGPAEAPDLHRLPGTNLAFRMPGEVAVTDMSFGGPAFLVRGEKGCEVMFTTMKAGLPRSMGQAKEAIQADTIRWRRFTREERSPQGWILEYETDGLAEPAKVAYGFNVRVNAEGAVVACSRVVESREAAKCGVATCLSLAQLP